MSKWACRRGRLADQSRIGLVLWLGALLVGRIQLNANRPQPGRSGLRGSFTHTGLRIDQNGWKGFERDIWGKAEPARALSIESGAWAPLCRFRHHSVSRRVRWWWMW